jgi:hypothetical protein
LLQYILCHSSEFVCALRVDWLRQVASCYVTKNRTICGAHQKNVLPTLTHISYANRAFPPSPRGSCCPTETAFPLAERGSCNWLLDSKGPTDCVITCYWPTDCHNMLLADRLCHNMLLTDRLCHNLLLTDRLCHNLLLTDRLCHNLPLTDRLCHNMLLTNRLCHNLLPRFNDTDGCVRITAKKKIQQVQFTTVPLKTLT